MWVLLLLALAQAPPPGYVFKEVRGPDLSEYVVWKMLFLSTAAEVASGDWEDERAYLQREFGIEAQDAEVIKREALAQAARDNRCIEEQQQANTPTRLSKEDNAVLVERCKQRVVDARDRVLKALSSDDARNAVDTWMRSRRDGSKPGEGMSSTSLVPADKKP